MRKPGAALISQIAPPASLYDCAMSGVRKSTPPTSSPTACTARTAISRLSGCTTSVTSAAVPPVLRLAVRRSITSRRRRHGVGRVAALAQQQQRLRVELDLGEHLLVPDAAARVGVERVHQLAHRAPAVAHHVAGHALAHRHQLAADDEHAVVVPRDEALDEHRGRVLGRDANACGPRPRRAGRCSRRGRGCRCTA
jgi:hypothetical protein